MSNYGYNYDNKAITRRGSRLELWDMLSILVLMITAVVGLYFVLVYLSPNSPINPFPPNPFDPNATLTPTITPIQLQPTWTLTPEILGTETPTLIPTQTLAPSATPLSLISPTFTPLPTKTPKSPFSVTVSYRESTIFHPELGCNWQGIGGTVVDVNNADIVGGLVINLVGTYNGKSVGPNGFTPTVPGVAPAYGRSGFEFFLGTVPISSKGTLIIQLVDLAGFPLSENTPIETSSECSKNLALVRFKKNP
ncbi:MAG TPA: hypothetical protein VJ022_14755 [Anaerolineales bacterium]|nr:hypothetical protein [Anaerolineales bacterium]